jgi:hypothetical protein
MTSVEPRQLLRTCSVAESGLNWDEDVEETKPAVDPMQVINTRSRADDLHQQLEWFPSGIVHRAEGTKSLDWFDCLLAGKRAPNAVFEAKPTAPVVEAKPTAPVVEAKPTSPVVEAKPTAPVVEAKPTAPVVKAKAATKGPLSVKMTKPSAEVTLLTVELPAPVVEQTASIAQDDASEWHSVTAKVRKQAPKPVVKGKKQAPKSATKEKKAEPKESTSPTVDTQEALFIAQDQLIDECIGQIPRETCQNVAVSLRHTLNYSKILWVKFPDDDVVPKAAGTQHKFSRAHFFGNYNFQKKLRERLQPLLPGAWIHISPGSDTHTFRLRVVRAKDEA